jgi:hypothetical protein
MRAENDEGILAMVGISAVNVPHPIADNADVVAWIHRLDELMDAQRQALALTAAVRRRGIHELVSRNDVPTAAAMLGVTRQAIYKALPDKEDP